MNDANAQITTTASMMFQNSRRYEPGCRITPRSIICNVKRISFRSIHTSVFTNLQYHFDGKYNSEHVVNHVQVIVPFRVIVDRVFGGQCHAAQYDYEHYEEIEIPEVHDPMGGSPDAVDKNSVLLSNKNSGQCRRVLNYPLVGVNKNMDEYGNMGFGPSSSSSSSALLSSGSSKWWCFRWCLISETLRIIS